MAATTLPSPRLRSKQLDQMVNQLTPKEARDVLRRIAIVLGYREVERFVNDIGADCRYRWTLTDKGRTLTAVR